MKLSEIEHRILALEHALSNLQQCPADPCHVHYAAEAEVAEPTYDVTQENWKTRQGGIVVTGHPYIVCMPPDPDQPWYEGNSLGESHWPQRKVLIVHAPEMYRELVRLHNLAPSWSELDYLRKLLTTIKKELQENE